jgi:hypothetical protein
MAHRNLQERRELIARLAYYRITFNSVVVADLARAFGCSPSAIRVDVRVVGNVRLSQNATKQGGPDRDDDAKDYYLDTVLVRDPLA